MSENVVYTAVYKQYLLGYQYDVDISFGHSCSFHNNLTLNYYIPQDQLAIYDNYYLYVEKDVYEGCTIVSVEKMKLEGELTENGWKFAFTGIAAAEAGNELRATLFAELQGVTYVSQTDIYSVKEYAYNRLQKSTDDEFKTLLVDMLNYCSTAQSYFNVNTLNLVNADLTEEYLAYGTQDAPVVQDTSSVVELEGATAKVVAKSVVFDNNIGVKFYLDLSAYTDLSTISVKISYFDSDGRKYITVISSDEFVWDQSVNYYSVRFDSINCSDLRSQLTVTILEGEQAVSNEVIYSVETYVYNRLQKTTNELFKELLNNMIKYSDAANAYFY